jgi:amidohydrolase
VIELNYEELVKLRKELHKYPELAGKETNTSARIKNFIEKFNPDETITGIGGNGVAFIFKGSKEGQTILFRCELDALPIQEQNNLDYKSSVDNVAHKCGHDGHMTILSGLASLFKNQKPEKGKVVILFQPAEETGEGAKRVLEDKKFAQIKPDYVFALHNLPGFPLRSVVIKPEIFAAASKGMIVKLFGKTSHASEPENGITPTPATASIIQRLPVVPNEILSKNNFGLVTVIHVRIGNVAFGTTPGYAEVMATLRSYKNEDMKLITDACERIVKEESEKYGLSYSIEWTEEFPSSVNNNDCIGIIKKCSEKLNLKIIDLEKPFKWSEDFGHFLEKYKGAIFGIGSGEDHPDLHNPDYDFPDEIIEPSVKLFFSITQELI